MRILFTMLIFLLTLQNVFSQIDGKSKDINTLKSKIDSLTIQALKLRRGIKQKIQEDSLKSAKDINMTDSLLLRNVITFLDKYGWKSEKDVGEITNLGFFLGIQHSNIETMEEYRPLIDKAYNERNISNENYAAYQDRMKVLKGLPQIFGTQFYFDSKENKNKFYEIRNIDKVDKRRRKLKLSKLKKYAKNNKIDF